MDVDTTTTSDTIKYTFRDYARKIYKIEPIGTFDEGDIFIGSTVSDLIHRLLVHKSQYKLHNEGIRRRTSVYQLFEKYGPDNCHIVLIEAMDGSSKVDMLNRAAHYIKLMKCVNRCMPLRSRNEYYHDHKEANKLKRFNCTCGSNILLRQKTKHLRTTIHQNYLKMKLQPETEISIDQV